MLQGKVIELFISKSGISDRQNKEEIFLDELGIKEDKFYNKKIDRSILIASQESYKIAQQNGIDAPYSSLGENILIDINPYGLDPGDEIEIGETILLITNNCTICNSLAKVDKKLPQILANDRGIFAKTLKGGNIRKGDTVIIKKY